MPKYRKSKKAGQAITSQYRTGLKRSLNRIDDSSFAYYNLKISNHKLLKYLISKAYTEIRYLPHMVEELIIKGLSKDKTFKDYVENDLDVEIRNTTLMQFSPIKRYTTQEERQKGHSSLTAS